MRFKIFVLFVFITLCCYPCACVPINAITPSLEIQKAVRKNSECILVGSVYGIDVKQQIFELRVIESLDRSDLQGNVYITKGWKYCSPYVEFNGYWLIYGFTEDGFLRPNVCGISRSFDMFGRSRIQNLHSKDAKQNPFDEKLRKDYEHLQLEINALRRHRKLLGKIQKSNI